MTEWHCIERDRERYGINLTQADVRQIEARCEAGEGRTGRKEDGTQFHLIIVGDRVLYVVYRLGADCKTGKGRVITVAPQDAGNSLVKSDGYFTRRRTGRFKPKRPGWQ